MNNYFPGFEPDFDVRQELRFIGGVLDLRQFNKIFIAVSGGKDSHAMLWLVKELADKQGVADRLLAMYADTGMEWHDAGAHVEALCQAAGVELATVKPVKTLIERMKWQEQRFIERGITRKDGTAGRIMFPTLRCRYCTGEQKVAPMDKLTRRYSGKLLRVTGERWAESKARSSYTEFVEVPRLNTATRRVFGWRPMLAWSEADVWAKVRETGVARHQCYDLGCGRLGCAGCIFSGDHDLKIEMRENPQIFEALDKLEIDSGYTMSMDKRRIRDRIKV